MLETVKTKLHKRQRNDITNRILSRKDLKEWLKEDSRNIPLWDNNPKSFVSFMINILKRLFVGPLSDQKYIWLYVKTMRYAEYHLNTGHYIRYAYYLWKLRRYSRITGFQIEPNTIGKGVSIWHFGTIIINEGSRIEENLTIQPQVVLGWNGKKAPKIGNNVTIFGGSFIYGDITIGDNVTIGCNSYVCHDVPSNCVVAGTPAKIIRTTYIPDNQYVIGGGNWTLQKHLKLKLAA